jgi:hypothetical protein
MAISAAAIVATVRLSLGSAFADNDGRGGDNPCAKEQRMRNSGPVNGRLHVIGLTADQRLICFREDKPDRAKDIGAVSGLSGDTTLVGIDFRPANNALYGVGDAGGVYTIDPRTAAATKAGQLSVALGGSALGVDVNPAADALRIVSDTGQNLRFSFAAGTTATDTPLAYPPNPAFGIAGAAYTNNDNDPSTATTLYDIDATLDQVAIQSPANSGQLVATGKLGVDTTAVVGFDIHSALRNGTTVDVRALATLVVGGETQLYRIALFSGKATLAGSFGAGDDVIDIAVPLNQL